MDRAVDQARVGIGVVHPGDRRLAGVRAAVVDDPEDGLGRRVGLAGHDLLNEAAERLDPGLGLAAPEQAGVVNVPGGQVCQRAAALVFELDQRRSPGTGWDRRVAARERLQLGLLVGADDVFAGVQQPALKAPGVQIEHPARLGLELRVAREDPRTRLPRL
jgi:hypothetical protein